jgi:hypothetical protein
MPDLALSSPATPISAIFVAFYEAAEVVIASKKRQQKNNADHLFPKNWNGAYV